MTQKSSLTELIHTYYIDKLSQTVIAQQFDLPGSHEIFRQFGEYHHKEPCAHCGTSLLSKYANRTHSTERFKEAKSRYHAVRKEIPLNRCVQLTEENYKVYLPKCLSCGHYPDAMCDCKECTTTRDINLQILTTTYQKKLVADNPPVDLTSLDAKHLLFIACFHNANSDKANVRTSDSKKLAEIDIFDLSSFISLDDLMKVGLVNVDPSCIESCIEMTSPTTHIFHNDKLKYIFVGADDTFWIQRVKQQSRSLINQPKSRDDVLRLWGELALKEASIYYAKLSYKHGIPFKRSPEVISNIKRGIVESGLFETIAAITWCIRKASDKLREENIYQNHAENFASNKFKWWVEEIRHWKPVARDSNLFPEPKIVSFFVEFFLPFTTDYGLTPLRELAAPFAASEDTSNAS